MHVVTLRTHPTAHANAYKVFFEQDILGRVFWYWSSPSVSTSTNTGTQTRWTVVVRPATSELNAVAQAEEHAGCTLAWIRVGLLTPSVLIEPDPNGNEAFVVRTAGSDLVAALEQALAAVRAAQYPLKPEEVPQDAYEAATPEERASGWVELQLQSDVANTVLEYDRDTPRMVDAVRKASIPKHGGK